jgi:hypothetical protein
MPKPRKHRAPSLRVVLDTSALFTATASTFLRREVSELITEAERTSSLAISWYVPSVVRHERHFQMLMEARKYLPTIEKLERLLGHNLNITDHILELRVKEAVDSQVKELNLIVLEFDPKSVDWVQLSEDAVFRRPPFQPGEKEKGFRDALILESFVQLVQASPTTSVAARMILVSGDGLLREAAQARTSRFANVYVLDSVDALKGLINTLDSTADEGFIALLQEQAGKIFFVPGEEANLYHKAGVQGQLDHALRNGITSLPNSAERYDTLEWSLNPPRFVSKQGQKIVWVSRFEASLRAVRSPQTSVTFPQAGTLLSPSVMIPTTSQIQVTPPAGSAFSTLEFAPSIWPAGSFSTQDYSGPTRGLLTSFMDQTVATGKASLDVMWSTSLTAGGSLTRPKVNEVVVVEVVWS